MASFSATGGKEQISWNVSLSSGFTASNYNKLVITTGSHGSSYTPTGATEAIKKNYNFSDRLITYRNYTPASNFGSNSSVDKIGTYQIYCYVQQADTPYTFWLVGSARVTVTAASPPPVTKETPSFSLGGITDSQVVISYWDTSDYPYLNLYVRTGTVSGSGTGVYDSGWINTRGSDGQRTVTKLSPGTTYTANVRYNTRASSEGSTWIGGRQFTTTAVYSYKITYYKNDGSDTSKTFSTTKGNKIEQSYTIPDPVEDLGWTRTGYYFQGWFNNSTTTGTQYLVGSTYKTSSNKSIYAHWQPNSYTIYFNGNGATSGSMSSMSCYYGSTYELNSNAYKRVYTLTYNKNYTGASSSDISVPCTFLYWSCNNSTYRDGASVSNLTSIDGGSVTMYAQWEYGSVTLPTLIRSGYKFDGWYTSNGSYIGAGGSSYTVKSDQTIYAHWKEDVISPTISNVSHTDTNITISLDRNNATAGYWIIEASLSNFGEVKHEVKIESTTQTTITLTGLTPETTYYIRARHVNGGVSASSNVISVTTRTSTFQWTSNDSLYVIKSAVFTDAITAAKWNELIKKVNWCRKRNGWPTASLNNAVSGQPILATNFTAMRNAIADMGIVVTPAREPGDEILATYFANSDTSLKSAINAVITTL